MTQLLLYLLANGLGSFQTGWAVCGNSQTAQILIAQFGWDKSEAQTYNSFINSSSVLGLAIGSLTAGNVITGGRRKAAIQAELIAIVACLCTEVMSLPTICFGRFLQGYAAGVLNIVMGKSLDETVPSKYATMFGCQTNTFICISVFLALIMGLLLPTSEADFVTDSNWRIIYAMPCVFAVLQILLYLTVCRHEPVNFLIANGRDWEATELLKKIYKVDEGDGLDEINRDDIYAQYIAHQRANLNPDSNDITLHEAVFGPTYGLATKVCFVLNVFN